MYRITAEIVAAESGYGAERSGWGWCPNWSSNQYGVVARR